MLPAMPWPRPRSTYSSTSAVSSRTATRVSHGSALMRICLGTGQRLGGGRHPRRLGGGGGAGGGGGGLAHRPRGGSLRRQVEQRGDDRARPQPPLPPHRDLERKALRR